MSKITLSVSTAWVPKLSNERLAGHDGGLAVPRTKSLPRLSFGRPQGLEGRPQFLSKNRWLLPCREVATFVELVVINEIGIGPLGPAPRSLICLAGEDAHGHRNRDALSVPKATLVFPIEPRRRDTRVRQPIERDVIENLIPRQFARGARGSVQSRGDRSGRLSASIIVVEKPGSQADGRIRNAVQRLRARCHKSGVGDSLLQRSVQLLVGARFLGRQTGWRRFAG